MIRFHSTKWLPNWHKIIYPKSLHPCTYLVAEQCQSNQWAGLSARSATPAHTGIRSTTRGQESCTGTQPRLLFAYCLGCFYDIMIKWGSWTETMWPLRQKCLLSVLLQKKSLPIPTLSNRCNPKTVTGDWQGGATGPLLKHMGEDRDCMILQRKWDSAIKRKGYYCRKLRTFKCLVQNLDRLLLISSFLDFT